MQSGWLQQFLGNDAESVSRRKFMQSGLVAGVAAGAGVAGAEVGQVGPQFDGLGHIGCIAGKDGDMNEMRFYNGVAEAEMADAYGLKNLGVEHCKPFFTRAVLIDVAAVKGRMMNAGEEITVA